MNNQEKIRLLNEWIEKLTPVCTLTSEGRFKLEVFLKALDELEESVE